ncbi:MAG: PEP-CTERM sorting domain-containing protein [Chloroflexaceae bacterium]|nr:PEP-CTERM sorting domain-containing protein [Chloroflexaceae bacterium]
MNKQFLSSLVAIPVAASIAGFAAPANASSLFAGANIDFAGELDGILTEVAPDVVSFSFINPGDIGTSVSTAPFADYDFVNVFDFISSAPLPFPLFEVLDATLPTITFTATETTGVTVAENLLTDGSTFTSVTIPFNGLFIKEGDTFIGFGIISFPFVGTRDDLLTGVATTYSASFEVIEGPIIAVPEPASLLGLGLVGSAILTYRRRSAKTAKQA